MGRAADGIRKQGPSSLYSYAAALALAVLCSLLAAQNRTLKERVASQARVPPLPLPLAGEQFSVIPYQDGSGVDAVITYDDPAVRCYVLAIFSPNCPACQVAFSLWERMAQELPAGIRMLALAESQGDDEPFTADWPAQALEVGWIPKGFHLEETLGIKGTPSTLLVSKDGVVLASWPGPTDTEGMLRIARYVKGVPG